MPNNNTTTKNHVINIRVSDIHLTLLQKLKGQYKLFNNTDFFLSGISLLDLIKAENSEYFVELINALIIRDDLLRCLNKPDNPQIDNIKNHKELQDALFENQKNILFYLKKSLSL